MSSPIKTLLLTKLNCFIMKTKLVLWYCLFNWIFYTPLSINAQALKYTITYNSKTKHYSRCAKGEEKLLNDFDRVNMRSYQEEKSYIIKVLSNGDREITIFHLKSNQFPDDTPSAAKTIIDKDGVKSYSADGKVLTNIPHSAIYLEYQKAFKNNLQSNDIQLAPKFKKITDAELNDLKIQGISVKNINGKGLHIRNQNKEVLYDTVNKIIENRLFEDKLLKHSNLQKFKLNKFNEIIPIFKKEINLDKTNKGNKLWRFKEEDIINYKITYPLNKRNDTDKNLSFNVYPNPASKELTVQLPRNIYEKTAHITISDMLSRVIFQKQTNASLEIIDIDKFKSGVYLLQVETGTGDKLTKKFIKQ
jgi:hypothetical protein